MNCVTEGSFEWIIYFLMIIIQECSDIMKSNNSSTYKNLVLNIITFQFQTPRGNFAKHVLF